MFLFRNAFFSLRWVCAVPTLMGMCCVRAFIHLDFGAQERGLALKHQVRSVRLVGPDTCLTQKIQKPSFLPLKSHCPGWAGTAVGRQGEDATLQGLPVMSSEMAGPTAIPPKNEFAEKISSTFVPQIFWTNKLYEKYVYILYISYKKPKTLGCHLFRCHPWKFLPVRTGSSF